mgnify:CR=1 FL=1
MCIRDRISPLLFGNIDPSHIRIEFETAFRDMVIFSKKRYVGRYMIKKGRPEDGYEWKGLEYVRSDTPQIVKNIQENLGISMLNDEPWSKRKEYLDKLADRIMNKELTFHEVGSPRQLKKDPEEYKALQPHVAGSLYSNVWLGTNFKKGDKPMWCYVNVEKGTVSNTNAIAYMSDTPIPDVYKIDYDKVIDRMIQPKISNFLSVMGEKYVMPRPSRGTLDYFWG